VFLHPVNHLVVSKFEYELVDDTVDADSPAGKLELGVSRIVEDEVVLVKVRELCTTNAASHLRSGQPHKTTMVTQAGG